MLARMKLEDEGISRHGRIKKQSRRNADLPTPGKLLVKLHLSVQKCSYFFVRFFKYFVKVATKTCLQKPKSCKIKFRQTAPYML